MLVLDSPYHGYYLHCDSPYPHADDTMKILTRHLRNEENAEASARGLHDEFPQLQTFEIWLTPAWRRAWEKRLTKGGGAHDDDGGALGGGGGGARGGGQGRGGIAMQDRPPMLGRMMRGSKTSLRGRNARRAALQDRFERAEAMTHVNAFLKQFFKKELATTHRDLDWQIKVQSFYDKITLRPPEGLAGGRVILQPDNGFFGQGATVSGNGDYHFTSTMLLGHDLDLLIFCALTYGVFDMWIGHATASIILTYAATEALRAFRAFFGERHLSEDTFVDDRFLL